MAGSDDKVTCGHYNDGMTDVEATEVFEHFYSIYSLMCAACNARVTCEDIDRADGLPTGLGADGGFSRGTRVIPTIFRPVYERGPMTDTVRKFIHLQLEAQNLFVKKNADYGDSFKEDGVLGVMIRQKDKLNRLITLARQGGEGALKEESLRDTLLDYSNYSLMAIIAYEESGPVVLRQAEPRTPPPRRCTYDQKL